jgi:hypothetical protein
MKKAQIKLFESIAILVIFIILVAIGIRFYSSAQINSLREAQTRFSRLDSVKTSIIISNMPEISCSFEGITDTSCTDLYKVKAWVELNADTTDLSFKDFYYRQLGASLIVVHELYPEDIPYIIYNQSTQQTSSDYLMIPTVIHRPSNKNNHFGILAIRTYYG